MSQFRKDLVSGEWIIVAPERAKRPHDFLSEGAARVPTPKESCPFELPHETGNWPPYLGFPNTNETEWQIAIIPNKFPALQHSDVCPAVLTEGPYEFSAGIGYHDLLIVRDHDTAIADIDHAVFTESFVLLQERYRAVGEDPCLTYTSTHFNWGPSAGASLYHPHFQLLTLPIIPPHIIHSLSHSFRYFQSNGTCPHCDVMQFELQGRKRIIAENDHAVALAPFASRQPFEVKIYPKEHYSHFEDTPRESIAGVTAVLKESLERIRTNLHDPDLNFFIHTSPLKNKELYSHYHWHMEIIPKVSIQAGFELSTGVLINVMEPETAAKMLRGEQL